MVTVTLKIKSKPKDAVGRPPIWTYTLGAIVAAGTLIWAIVSFFIPNPDPPKPPVAATPAPAPVPNVTVSGSGNVGVGAMTGGHIEVGKPSAPPRTVPPPAKDRPTP